MHLWRHRFIKGSTCYKCGFLFDQELVVEFEMNVRGLEEVAYILIESRSSKLVVFSRNRLV